VSRVAVIPARGGSKGIPRKNVRLFQGRPLIAWVIEAALESKVFDDVMVSTDDEEIGLIAQHFGATVPFLRPQELSTDSALTIDVLRHLFQRFPHYEYGTLLQPTSPLTTCEDILRSVELMKELQSSSMVSVVETKQHPQLLFVRGNNLRLQPLSTDTLVDRRQDRPKTYALNGAMYNFETSWLMRNGAFIGEETVAYEMPRERSVDIDDEFDWQLANWLFSLTRSGAK
jgi:CMP-N,N'-diacetyllegionaminic acid synthase